MAKRDVRHADADLYERDYYAWVQRQLELLRAGRLDDIDLDNLIEEVEDLGKRDLQDAESRTRTILRHLLKLGYSPSITPRHGWETTVLTQRIDLRRNLTATLRRHVTADLDGLYAEARRLAAKDLARDRITADLLPSVCPYTLDQILDLDWLPENVHLVRDGTE
jgi:hypothetical protein